MKHTIPALVLSCHNTGLGVIRALGTAGVPVIALFYDRNDMGQVSRYCLERHLIPHPVREEARFVERLLSLAGRYGGGLLFPCDDETLSAVSKHHLELSSCYRVTCQSWDLIGKIVDKRNTYELARCIGVPHPRTRLVEETSGIDADFVRTLGFPCLVKPCESHIYAKKFGKKLAKVGSFQEMERECNLAVSAGLRVMIQEYIPGAETNNINYNSYTVSSRVVADFTAKKIRLCPPESGVPCVVKSSEIPQVRPYAAKVLAALEYSGYSCMEFKRDPRDGVYKLLEVNGRYNRSIALSLRCGVNFPYLNYDYLVHGRIPAEATAEYGVYWIDLTKDLFSWKPYLLQGGYRASSLVLPYVRPHVFSDLSAGDIRPFNRRISNLVLRAAKMLEDLVYGKKRRKSGR